MSLVLTPTFEEFQALAEFGNLIPVRAEVLADSETPVSAFLKLTNSGQQPDAPAFLLESVEGGEALARYSFLGVGARATLKTKGNEVWIEENGKTDNFTLEGGRDPLHIIDDMMSSFRFVDVPGLPRFCGGMVGFLGYDLVRFFEKLPNAPHDDRNLPDCHLLMTDTVLIFDAVRHSVVILNNAYIEEHDENGLRAAYDEARAKIEAVVERLSTPASGAPLLPLGEDIPDLEAVSNMPDGGYQNAVRRCVEYIRAGDCVQIVPSQRFQVPFHAAPFDVYRALRYISPAPYMFYLNLEDVNLIGASPEVLVTEDAGRVVTRPLAGTRRRGSTPEEDAALEAELLADPKERAEHVMLVDLHRNDIGRVCEYGSVEVEELLVVEKFSHVMHIVSTIVGKIRHDKNAFDLLRATFPAGTLSGAPKVRAMQIIDELEPTRRGPYGGAIGYFSFSGNTDTCITLRTIIAKDNIAYVQAGAGIVADSDPVAEDEETRNKAKAALRAIALAERSAAN
jgi:anthranilate synthase component 1